MTRYRDKKKPNKDQKLPKISLSRFNLKNCNFQSCSKCYQLFGQHFQENVDSKNFYKSPNLVTLMIQRGRPESVENETNETETADKRISPKLFIKLLLFYVLKNP